MMAGALNGECRMRHTLAPLFSLVFCLIISELLGEFFLRRKKREKSTNCQDRTHSFKPCYCRMQSWFALSGAKQHKQKRFSLIIPFITMFPQRKKVNNKCSNAATAQKENTSVLLLCIPLSRAFSSWKLTFLFQVLFDKHPQDGRK